MLLYMHRLCLHWLLMEQFDTLPIQCKHIEHMHEGVCKHIEHMHEGVLFRKNNF